MTEKIGRPAPQQIESTQIAPRAPVVAPAPELEPEPATAMVARVFSVPAPETLFVNPEEPNRAEAYESSRTAALRLGSAGSTPLPAAPTVSARWLQLEAHKAALGSARDGLPNGPVLKNLQEEQRREVRDPDAAKDPGRDDRRDDARDAHTSVRDRERAALEAELDAALGDDVTDPDAHGLSAGEAAEHDARVAFSNPGVEDPAEAQGLGEEAHQAAGSIAEEARTDSNAGTLEAEKEAAELAHVETGTFGGTRGEAERRRAATGARAGRGRGARAGSRRRDDARGARGRSGSRDHRAEWTARCVARGSDGGCRGSGTGAGGRGAP
jgi:hypothetical protein